MVRGYRSLLTGLRHNARHCLNDDSPGETHNQHLTPVYFLRHFCVLSNFLLKPPLLVTLSGNAANW